MSGGLAGEDSLISTTITFGVQESAVTDNQKSHPGLLVRAVAAVGAAGASVAASVAASALTAKARGWLKQMETPTREFARQHWTLAKAASAAAADTWRNGHSAMRAESVQQGESVQPPEPPADSPTARPSAEKARERPSARATQGQPPE